MCQQRGKLLQIRGTNGAIVSIAYWNSLTVHRWHLSRTAVCLLKDHVKQTHNSMTLYPPRYPTAGYFGFGSVRKWSNVFSPQNYSFILLVIKNCISQWANSSINAVMKNIPPYFQKPSRLKHEFRNKFITMALLILNTHKHSAV